MTLLTKVLSGLAVLTAVGSNLSNLRADNSSDVVSLPITTIEHSAVVDGKNHKKETKEYLGICALPYPTQEGFGTGQRFRQYRKEVTKERIRLGGKTHDVTRIAWIVKDLDHTNFAARKITFWIADHVSAPSFLFPIALFPLQISPDLPLPEGTVKFDFLPTKPSRADSGNKGKATINGSIQGEEEIPLGSRKIRVFKYSFVTQSDDHKVKGEFWLSKDLPGSLYLLTADKSGPRETSIRMQVKALRLETVPDGLYHVKAGEFAFAVPEGWKPENTRTKGEIFRLVKDADPDLHQTITMEMKPAAGRSAFDWAHQLAGEKLNLGFNAAQGLADSPIWHISEWEANKQRTLTKMIVAVHDDRLFLISHWQDQFETRKDAGWDPLDKVVQTWRWLKKRK